MLHPELVKEIEQYGILAQGKRELVAFYNGEHITHKDKCLAMCYHCSSYYADGRVDCKIDTCPLYQGMPYRKIDYDTNEKFDAIDLDDVVESKYQPEKNHSPVQTKKVI